MTASCGAISRGMLASTTSSHSVKNLLGSSATPSRDSSSPTTIFRTPYTSDWSRCCELTDQAAETHRCKVQAIPGRQQLRLGLEVGADDGPLLAGAEGTFRARTLERSTT